MSNEKKEEVEVKTKSEKSEKRDETKNKVETSEETNSGCCGSCS